MFNNTYNGKKVLVTGDTGFKGSWLCLWLKKLGADVYGLANGIPSSPSLFETAEISGAINHKELDIRDYEALKSHLDTVKPDIVFHLAAEAIVRTCYENPRLAFETNTLGTINLLEAIRQTGSTKIGVFITSDKCYENVEWEFGYRETDRLGGKDPYSASKACAEIAFSSYFRSYFSDDDHFFATARAGNVIGGGDWAKDRIIPDAIRSWSKNESLHIRSPWATRPWQHVLEPLSGYLTLGASLLSKEENINGESFNFGPKSENDHTVQTLIEEMKKTWKEGNFTSNQDDSCKKEATLLKLNIDKALARLEWLPNFDFDKTVSFTAEWYVNFYNETSKVRDFTLNQISNYEEHAKGRNLVWTK